MKHDIILYHVKNKLYGDNIIPDEFICKYYQIIIKRIY